MTQEQLDTAVQSMRDQGIADACAGRVPVAHLASADGVWLGERLLTPSDGLDYRSAFAYARAYAENR